MPLAPVFEQRLSADQRTLELECTDLDSMHMLLEYMYSGNIALYRESQLNALQKHQKLLEHARQLFKLANMYQVMGLKQFLYEKIFGLLSIENAIKSALVLDADSDPAYESFRNQIMSWILNRIKLISERSDIEALLLNEFTRKYLCRTMLGKRKLLLPTLITENPLKLRCVRPDS